MVINKISGIFTFLLIFGAIVIPRAYSNIKLIILVFLLVTVLINNYIRSSHYKKTRILSFYVALALINLSPIVVGYISGNSIIAIEDGLRLGIIFPIIFSVLWISLIDYKYENFIDETLRFSAITLFILISLTIVQSYGLIDIFSTGFIEENNLYVGFHDGFIQIVSHNIASLFFIVGYLLYKFLTNRGVNSNYDKLVLYVILFISLISGRRALQYIIITSPILILATAYIFSETNFIFKKLIKIYIFIGVLIIIFLIYAFSINLISYDSFIGRFADTFADDKGARISQMYALFGGFLESPILGAGIGSYVGIIRSDFPWNYELTYFQLLFNYGFIATTALAWLFIREILVIRYNANTLDYKYDDCTKSIFNGLLFLFLGAATNPYLSSFEFLIYFGIIPFAASIPKVKFAK